MTHLLLRALLPLALLLIWPGRHAAAAPAVEFDRRYSVGRFPVQQNIQVVSIPASVFDPADTELLQGARVQTGWLDGYSEITLAGFRPGERYDLELWQREDRQGTRSDFVQVLVNDVEVGKTYNGYAGWSQLDAHGLLQDGRYLRLRYGFRAEAAELRLRVVASHAWWPGPAHGIALALRILASPVEARIAPVGDGVVPARYQVKVQPRSFGDADAAEAEADEGEDGQARGRERVRVKLEPDPSQPATARVTLDGSASVGALHFFWELEDELGLRFPLDNRPVLQLELGPGRYRVELRVGDGVHLSEPARIDFALRPVNATDLLQGPLALNGIALESRRLQGGWLKADLDREAFVASLGAPGEKVVALTGVGRGEAQVRLRPPHDPDRRGR